MVGVVAATTLVSGGLVGVGTAGASTPSSAANSVQAADSSAANSVQAADSSDRALSATKPGTKCKAKQKGKTRNTKYGTLKCTKAGKKYVWKKVAPLDGTVGYSPWDFVKDAWNAYKFAAACKANLEKGKSCMSSEELRSLDDIKKKLDDLSTQIAANQAATTAALNVLYAAVTASDLRAEINLVADNMSYATTASLKTNEYVCGFNRVAKVLAGQPVTECQVTNVNGNKDATATTQYGSPTSLADLALPGGLRERLFDATWNRPDWSDPVKIGRSLEERMAGANSNVGLLNAVFNSWKASVSPKQAIPTGSPPVMVSPADAQMMNTVVQQYVNQETAYFSSMILALQLKTDTPRTDGNSDAASDLKDMAENGINGDARFSLGRQLTDYTFPNPPGQNEFAANQSWVILGNGKVALLTFRNGATNAPVGYDPAASFWDVSAVSGAIINTGSKMSILQKAYPAALPGGDKAAWFAQIGDRVKQFELEGLGHSVGEFYSPDKAPGAIWWGGNVAKIYNVPCRFPVRMWDTSPNQDTSFVNDSDDPRHQNPDWNQSRFRVSEISNRSNFYTVVPGSGDTYNEVVRNNGAVPVYDRSTENYEFRTPISAGSGTLYRCDGKTSPNSKIVPASKMDVRLVTPTGLLTKLSAPREKFTSCKAMNRVFPHGLGKPGAKDKVHYAGGRKSTKFKRLTRIYKKNKKLDRDKDGITCEWTPKHKRGDRR